MRQRIVWIIALAVACLLAFWTVEIVFATIDARNETAVEHVMGLDVTIIAGPRSLTPVAPLGADFDATSDGSILLRGKSQLYEVPKGATDVVDTGIAHPPTSFALDGRDVALSITDGYLGTLSGGDEKARAGVPLPYLDARLAPSSHAGAIYMFGGLDRDYRLYRFFEDGTFQVLLETDEPIVAAADTKAEVYAATGRLIVRIASPRPTVMFQAPSDPGWGPIISIAAADDDLLFFSTPGRVFALKGGIALSIVNDSGGALRRRGDRLYVLDPHRDLLYALSPASLAMFKRTGK
jgi:hypothetical protein